MQVKVTDISPGPVSFLYWSLCFNLPVCVCVQNRLQERNDPPQLLVDTKQIFPVLFPYTPSALSLETLHIPASLGLNFLTRV